MSTKDMCKMMGWNEGSMQSWVKKLKIRRSAEEGMRAKKKNKTQNYLNTFSEVRNTIRKSQYEHGNTTSSANENSFRNAIADNIYKFFPSESFDIGVCCNAIGILETMEIDIPIFIYNVKTNELHRYAVEYNGPTHIDDSTKVKRAEERGWIYKSISDRPDFTSNPVVLIEAACLFCKQLADSFSK